MVSMRTIFLFIRGVDQVGRAMEGPRRDLTEMEKRQQDLARSSQRLLFGGAAFLAFAGMLVIGLGKIIEQSSRGAMIMGDLGVAIQRFITGVSEAMTQTWGPAIQGLTKWLDDLSRSPFWVQAIVWAVSLVAILTILAGISAWLGWIAIKLVIPVTGLLIKMGAFLALKAELLAAIGMALGGTLMGNIFYLTIPVLVSLVISYIISEIAPPGVLEWLHKYGPRTFYQERLPRYIGDWFERVKKGLTEGRTEVEEGTNEESRLIGGNLAMNLTMGLKSVPYIKGIGEWFGQIVEGFSKGFTQLRGRTNEESRRIGENLVMKLRNITVIEEIGSWFTQIGESLTTGFKNMTVTEEIDSWSAQMRERLTGGIRTPSIIEGISEWFTQLGKSFGEGFTRLGEGIGGWFARTRENLTTGIGDIPIRLTFPIMGLMTGATAFLALKTQLLDALTTAFGGTLVSGILLISVPVTLALIISDIISKQFDLKNTALLKTLDEVKGDIGEFEDLKGGRGGGFAQLWERVVNYISVSIDMSNSHYPPGTSPEDVADAVGKKMAENAANLGSRPGE